MILLLTIAAWAGILPTLRVTGMSHSAIKIAITTGKPLKFQAFPKAWSS
jgi:hypothetical protein